MEIKSLKMILWLKLIFDKIWNDKPKRNRMTLKLWWHWFNYMSKHIHMLYPFMRNRTKRAPSCGFHTSRFRSCPSNGFSMNRSERRAPYSLRSRAQVSVGSLQREKKNSTTISHRVRSRRAERIKLEMSKGAHVILQPLLLWMSQRNQDYEATGCLKQWITLSTSHMYSV